MKAYGGLICLVSVLSLASTANGQIVVNFGDGGLFARNGSGSAATENGFDGLDVNGVNTVDLSTDFDASAKSGGYDQKNSVTGINAGASFVLTATGDSSGVTDSPLGIHSSAASWSGLGINDTGSGNNFIGATDDFMSFRFEVGGSGNGAVLWEEISFTGLDSDANFVLQSDDFIGRGYDSNFSTGVTYDSLDGSFTFEDGQRGSTFLSTFDLKFVSLTEDSVVTLTYDGDSVASTGAARFSGFTIHAVPEPAGLALLGACGLGLLGYRRHRRKKTAV